MKLTSEQCCNTNYRNYMGWNLHILKARCLYWEKHSILKIKISWIRSKGNIIKLYNIIRKWQAIQRSSKFFIPLIMKSWYHLFNSEKEHIRKQDKSKEQWTNRLSTSSLIKKFRIQVIFIPCALNTERCLCIISNLTTGTPSTSLGKLLGKLLLFTITRETGSFGLVELKVPVRNINGKNSITKIIASVLVAEEDLKQTSEMQIIQDQQRFWCMNLTIKRNNGDILMQD